MNNDLPRDLFVLEDENNPRGSKVNRVWASTTLDQVFDNESPTHKTLREIIADLHVEIITGGKGNIVFPVTSVNGMTDDVVITARSIGLGNIDNTPDIDKPLSGPQRESIMEILKNYDFNIDLGDLYDHLRNHDNPHGVTVDQLDIDNRLSDFILEYIRSHSQSVSDNVHPDIRRLISDSNTRIDDLQNTLSSESDRLINGLEDHISDDHAHHDILEGKEDRSNKVLGFSTTENKDHTKYPTTRAVVEFVIDQIRKFNDTLPNIENWIDDIVVIDTRSDLPPLSNESHRKMYIIRNGNDSHSEIAICRMNQDDETYSWDISSLGSYYKFDPKYFNDSINGISINIGNVMDDMLAENGMLDTSLSNILKGYYNRNDIDKKHFVSSIHILPGTMDGHIRYYINEDLTTMSTDVEVPGLKRLAYLEWVTENELFDQSVQERHILTQAIVTRHIKDRAVTGPKMFTSSEGNVFLGVDKPNSDPKYMKLSADFLDDNSIALSKLKISDIANRVIGVTAAGSPEYLQINHDMLMNNVIDTINIINNAITTDKIGDKNVTNAKLSDNAVDGRVLSNGSITSQKIANDAVEERSIKDSSITTSKIKDASVTGVKLADDSVSTKSIKNKSVTNDKLANDSVGTLNVKDLSITNDKLADESVTTSKVHDESITEDKLADRAVTSSKIEDGSIYENHLNDDIIGTNHIKDGAITSDKIAPGAIKFEDIVPGGGISAGLIPDKSITGDKIADNSISTAHIQDQSVVARKIQCTWDHVIGNIDNEGSKIAHEIPIEELAESLKRFIKEGSIDPGGDDVEKPSISNGSAISTNTWIPNTEYAYPDKTYGRRLKGRITAPKNTECHTLISSRLNLRVYMLTDAGGTWEYKNNSGWMSLAGASISRSIAASLRIEMDGLYLDTISNEDRVDAKYDIWIRYTKNGEISPVIDPDGNVTEPDVVCDMQCDEITAEDIHDMFDGTFSDTEDNIDEKSLCQSLTKEDIRAIWDGTFVNDHCDDGLTCNACDEITPNEIRVLMGLDQITESPTNEPVCPFNCTSEISLGDIIDIYNGTATIDPDNEDYTNTVCRPMSSDTISAIYNGTYDPIDRSEYHDGYDECTEISSEYITDAYTNSESTSEDGISILSLDDNQCNCSNCKYCK